LTKDRRAGTIAFVSRSRVALPEYPATMPQGGFLGDSISRFRAKPLRFFHARPEKFISEFFRF